MMLLLNSDSIISDAKLADKLNAIKIAMSLGTNVIVNS